MIPIFQKFSFAFMWYFLQAFLLGMVFTSEEGKNSDYYTVGKQYVIVIAAYPGTTSETNDTYGVLHLKASSSENNNVSIRGHIGNLEASVESGWHIHTGKTCLDADLVGGHWYDTDSIPEEEDPWKQPKYRYRSDEE